jgi:hypothetical protein
MFTLLVTTFSIVGCGTTTQQNTINETTKTVKVGVIAPLS